MRSRRRAGGPGSSREETRGSDWEMEVTSPVQTSGLVKLTTCTTESHCRGRASAALTTRRESRPAATRRRGVKRRAVRWSGSRPT